MDNKFLEILSVGLAVYMHKAGSFPVSVNGQKKVVTINDEGLATGNLGGLSLFEAIGLGEAIVAGMNVAQEFRVGKEQFLVIVSDPETPGAPAAQGAQQNPS